MAWRQDVREGWRLFLPFVREVMTPMRRRIAVATVVVLGVGGAALFHALVPGLETAGARILMSLAVGIAASAIAMWVALFRWRPQIAGSEKFWGTPWGVEPRDDKEIRTAYAEGREPRSTFRTRIAAADQAEKARLGLCRVLFTQPAPAALVVAFLLAAISIAADSHWQRIGGFGGLAGAIVIGINLPTFLALLGRTTAPVATRPQGADPDPEPPSRSTPYRTLGTDHPDDSAEAAGAYASRDAT